MKLKTSTDEKEYCVCYKGKVKSQFSPNLRKKYSKLHWNLNFWATHMGVNGKNSTEFIDSSIKKNTFQIS